MSGTRILIAGFLFSIISSACTTRVIGGLDEAEANRVVMALEKASIPASKVSERAGRSVSWSVKVPSSAGPGAREVLESLSLPRPPQEGFKSIVEEDSLVPSASRERLKETVARGQEIARILETLEGVVQASVIIAPPRAPTLAGPLDGPPPEGTASALLKVSSDIPISKQDVMDLVAGAVPGVDPEGVTVVVTKAPAARPQEAKWAKLGPFVVSPSSRAPLLAALSVMALLNLALGSWAVASVVRRRRAKQTARTG